VPSILQVVNEANEESFEEPSPAKSVKSVKPIDLSIVNEFL
jgi:hypothetical protein